MRSGLFDSMAGALRIGTRAHEHLYVFRKPAEGENLKDYRYSVKWW